jgi:hypothetical protein
MKSEMDLLRMDERQRLCWLFANRAMIFIIGAIWLGIIGYELLQGRTQWFMIIMVPILALTRLVIYLYYSKKLNSRGSGRP